MLRDLKGNTTMTNKQVVNLKQEELMKTLELDNTLPEKISVEFLQKRLGSREKKKSINLMVSQ